MRVLFIANTFPSPDKKNAGAFNLRGVQNLIKHGVELKVVHFRSWSPRRKIVTTYKMDDVEVISVALPYYVKFSPRLIAANIWLYRVLFERIFKSRFLKDTDLIHSVGAGHAGIISGFIAKKYKIPHIAQCIGSDVNVILPEIHNFFGVKGWEDGVDIFTGNSQELRDNVQAIYPGKRAEVIYRGVNLKEFHPSANLLSNGHIDVTYLGGLSPKETKPFGIDQKGGVTLLKAWEIFKHHHKSENIKLKFCGPNINNEVVGSLLGKDPASLHIDVVGHMDRKKVASLLQGSHIVILPSMFEGLPNVAMEAAASGAALIGSRVGGIPEVITEGRNGYLVDRKNPVQIADRLNELVSDQQKLENFRKESRRYMEEKFDSAQFAEGYISLYKELISTK